MLFVSNAATVNMSTKRNSVQIDEKTSLETVSAETARGTHHAIEVKSDQGSEHLTVHVDGTVNFTDRDGNRSTYSNKPRD